jgi:hypothetical protein
VNYVLVAFSVLLLVGVIQKWRNMPKCRGCGSRRLAFRSGVDFGERTTFVFTGVCCRCGCTTVLEEWTK